ncbi:syntaxin-binding protein 6 isoform X3 [Clupea harengus]|nr:syntaxin-binding protein 6 isoform X3 [Clupea harengus]
MDTKLAISKEIFAPHDEKMLVAVQVKRRTKKRIPFLATGGPGDYSTFICISKTKKKPCQVSITKVKKFAGSSVFVRRSQWSIDLLRQVNGIDPNRDCAEFDLTFDTAFDQWVAGSAGEKGIFVQVLHTSCQQHCSERKPEFVNCQAHLLRADDQSVNSVFVRCKMFLNRLRKDVVSEAGHLLNAGNSILHTAADSVTSAVQKASQALNERGERLGRTEEKTEDMMNSAQHFADTAHKLAMKHKC